MRSFKLIGIFLIRIVQFKSFRLGCCCCGGQQMNKTLFSIKNLIFFIAAAYLLILIIINTYNLMLCIHENKQLTHNSFKLIKFFENGKPNSGMCYVLVWKTNVNVCLYCCCCLRFFIWFEIDEFNQFHFTNCISRIIYVKQMMLRIVYFHLYRFFYSFIFSCI